MLLAELNVRHTRRHMPTRRVALDDGYLPTSGSAFGGVLLGAVIAEHVPGLDEEQLDALHRLVDAARDGLTVPRIALRYRLQTDTHGLDLSRHRITGADVEAGHHAPDPRARPPRPARTAGDRRARWRRRRSRRRDAAPRSASSTPRSARPGVPARGARGPAHVPGPARAAALPAGCAGTGRVDAGNGQRRATSGAACRRSGAGRWRCSGCARACSWSVTTCRSASGASCVWRTPTTAPAARAPPSASPSSPTR